MPTAPYRLESVWFEATDDYGFDLTLFNLSDTPISGFRLAYSALTRTVPGHKVENGEQTRKLANYHEFAPPKGLTVAPGESWNLRITGLTRHAQHVNDGPGGAHLLFEDGTSAEVECADLILSGGLSTRAEPLLPEGTPQMGAALVPWPNEIDLQGKAKTPVALFTANGATREDMAAISAVTSLAKRIFPLDTQPFALVRAPGGLPLHLQPDTGLAADSYRITIARDKVTLAYGDAPGRHYGLVTLAQLLHGARDDNDDFVWPESGTIADAPRYEWRGSHLDVSRQFYSIESVTRFVDLLAWHKMNIFHWHLTDDEAWRLEIKAYPELIETGSKRGAHEKMVPQQGSPAATYEGHYTQDQVRALVAHAAAIHVEVVPEIDIPGHCNAVLYSLPHLRDPEEDTSEAYLPVQGYPNNALNPGMEETYEFLEKVLAEVVDLFPSHYIHLGGDEVAEGAWLQSPRARGLMQREGLPGTPELQAYLLNRAQEILSRHGRALAGWDEMSHGGGVSPEGALMMAWQKGEVGPALAEMGYDVIMTPGEAYYLDMAQADDWQESGASWAGTVPPHTTYHFEAAADFGPELIGKLKGVQACIWSESIRSRERFNRTVFPRLSAIAEAGWTQGAAKDWQRFSANTKLMPGL